MIYAAKRARQINAYYSQLGEGLLEYVGPLVDTQPQEKPLSIALREINAVCSPMRPAPGLVLTNVVRGRCGTRPYRPRRVRGRAGASLG